MYALSSKSSPKGSNSPQNKKKKSTFPFFLYYSFSIRGREIVFPSKISCLYEIPLGRFPSASSVCTKLFSQGEPEQERGETDST